MLEWISKLWHRNMIEFYTAMKTREHHSAGTTGMNLINETLSRRHQGQERTHCLITFISSSKQPQCNCGVRGQDTGYPREGAGGCG